MSRKLTGQETKKPRFNSDLPQVWLGMALIAVTGFGPALLGNAYWSHTFQLVNIYIAARSSRTFCSWMPGKNRSGRVRCSGWVPM